jgi:hypothetical protein
MEDSPEEVRLEDAVVVEAAGTGDLCNCSFKFIRSLFNSIFTKKNKMKRIIILCAVTFILTASAKAQNSEVGIINEQYSGKKETKKQKLNEIIAQASDEFNEEFGPEPDVKWKKEGLFYRARFSKEGQHFKVYYDEQAKQVGSISRKSFAELPANAQQYIDSAYKGFKKKNVLYFDDNELNETDMILYGKQFEDMDSYFVELKKGHKKIVLKINTTGEVSFFKQLS